MVAEILLGAKSAAVRATARSFDLGARADRVRLETMVMMVVARNHASGHAERFEVDELCRARPAEDPNVPVAFAQVPGIASIAAASSTAISTSASSHSPMTTMSAASFFSTGAGVAEPCGTDDDEDGSEIANRKCELLRDPQFRRRAAPKQIGWRGRDHRHVGTQRRGTSATMSAGDSSNKCPSISRTS